MVGYYRLKELGVRLASGAHIIPAEDFCALEEAERLIRAAEDKSAAIVADAEQAYEQEKLRGYEDGLQKARLEAVERLIGEQQTLDKALQGIEQELAALVGSCVRKLIDGFADTARAESVVRHALGKMRREKRVELRAPASLCSFLRSSLGSILADFPEIELVDVVEDVSLAPEQVVIETSIGRVDGNLGQRLEDLEIVIRRAHARGGSAQKTVSDAPEAVDE